MVKGRHHAGLFYLLNCCKPVLTVAYSVLPQVMHHSVLSTL